MSLRYFNAAGASFDGRLGERADRTLMLIPMLMLAALGRREPVDIYGTDYLTPDGTAIRDYIHVEDLAEAHARALDWASANEVLLVLNLGTGVGSSVREVIALVEEVSDRPVPVRWADRRPVTRSPSGRIRAAPERRAGMAGTARPPGHGRDRLGLAFEARGRCAPGVTRRHRTPTVSSTCVLVWLAGRRRP